MLDMQHLVTNHKAQAIRIYEQVISLKYAVKDTQTAEIIESVGKQLHQALDAFSY